MDLKEVIARIGYFRTKANLSARALSFCIDKNPAYITKLESGEYEPSVRVLLNIIDACGITVEKFFYHNIATYEVDKECLKTIEKLTVDKKTALNTLLN